MNKQEFAKKKAKKKKPKNKIIYKRKIDKQ